MVPPCVPKLLEATLVSVRSALVATGVATVTVLLGVGSGVVLVPAAVLVTVPLVAVTVALTTSVRVWPMLSEVVPAIVDAPVLVLAPLLVLALMKLKPALSTSVIVTFSAVLGPRLTSVTV